MSTGSEGSLKCSGQRGGWGRTINRSGGVGVVNKSSTGYFGLVTLYGTQSHSS